MHQNDTFIELSVVSYHRLSPRQISVKRFGTSGGSLGRSEKADWCLPDPERVVSGIHALIIFENERFFIKDQSTNGLFLNRSVEPIGQENQTPLAEGDVFCLGDYEVKVSICELNTKSHSDMPQVNKPIHNQKNTLQNLSLLDSGDGVSINSIQAPIKSIPDGIAISSIIERSDNDPLAQHFMAPSTLIPDEWEQQWTSNEEQFDTIPESLSSKAFDEKHEEIKVGQKIASPFLSQQDGRNASVAFLRGLGIDNYEQYLENSDEWWEQLGVALQESLSGLVQIMRTRSEVKSNFRVNQTTFQQKENNPLKFSASIDDAFHNLFNRSTLSFMPAKQAIQEAFIDINRHESAIIAGAKGAVNGILIQLSPTEIAKQDYSESLLDKLNPAQRKARFWNIYQLKHNGLVDEINIENSNISDEFVNAYDAFMNNR